jgi:small subunit ribosomal protein S1
MAFVSLGGKSEAMIDLRELKDEEGILRFGVGDQVEAFIIEAGAKGTILSRQLPRGAASMSRLADARLSGIPVEGLVLSVNKGGLEVAVGEVRAFCPISQVDLRYVENAERFVGDKLLFRVMEVRERNVVLSRRALLEEEIKAKAAETRKELAEGKVLHGKVTSVREFGAFVDLGGVEGMIPVSELSHARIRHPSEVVKAGDDVEVEVLRLEAPQPHSPDKTKHKERITLSMRSRQEDPWKVAVAELQEGQEVTGKVVRLQPFGAFVELKPGVDGLIHISALARRRIAHPKDAVSVGEEVRVVVERVDPHEKRIALRRVFPEEARVPAAPSAPSAPAAAPTPPAPRPRVGQVITGTIERIEPFGLFVNFPGGRGLVPASETGTDRGTDLKRTFKLGQELKAAIVEIEGGGKIRLSIPGAARAEERAEVEAWKKTQQPKGAGGKGFGTLADLFKEKLGGGQKA